MAKIIKPKDRDLIIRALRSGVVPRSGLQHIQVGRYNEIKSFISDIDNVVDGGTSFRLVIGEYGSGKTFFLSLVRSIAMEKGLVTMNADLSPAKRLYGREGQTRTLLSELVTSLSTRTRQDGGALQTILERFISMARQRADEESSSVYRAAEAMLADLCEYPSGFAFARVVATYCRAYDDGDNPLMQNAMRWLRCEYSTKTEAMRDVGVRDIIDDHAFFNTIVLYSLLVRKAGYKGLFVCLDEMVNLYKITNTVSRKANYEEVLNILNNTLQGNIQGLGVVMSGTPEFLTDPHRGLYSYEALRSRLAENSFSINLGLNDYNSTVLRLPNLTPEEMYLLLQNLRNIFALGNPDDYLVPDKAITAYLNHCSSKIGDSYFRTPRNTLKGFIDLLSVLQQYPDRQWSDIIADIDIAPDRDPSDLALGREASSPRSAGSDGEGGPSSARKDNDDELFASFKL